jgi:septal ring factor EnvC (AmiA/AmiB activator)
MDPHGRLRVMIPLRPLRRIAALAAPVLVLGLLACSESEEERLARAAKHVTSAREELERAREDLAKRSTAADEANQALAAARDRVAEAEARLQSAEASDELKVSDETLFRATQERLLEEDDLEDVAIKATVNQGVVVLSGRVPDEKLRDRAVEVARETPGIVGVESRIEIEQPAAE